MTHPRVQRAQWGLQKANHVIRQVSRDGAQLRTRIEIHLNLAADHGKAALACYDCDMAYPARLHIAASHKHAGMAHWCMGAIQQSLGPSELQDERTLLEDAVNTGLQAVDEAKK